MLISYQHQKLVLKLNNPQRVLNVVNGSAIVNYRGVDLVSVPFNVETFRLLHSLGIKPPSPIEAFYNWPGGTPFAAQRTTAGFLTLHDRAYVLNDMGTGKTRATLWAWDYLNANLLAGKLLVVAPLSTLERAWGDEIFSTLMLRDFSVLHGSKDKRKKMLDRDVDIYIINHDGIKSMLPELLKRPDIDTMVIDELAIFRNSGTDRYKALRKLANKMPRVWGLTGTPMPTAPTDAWAQCKLVNPELTTQYFSQFRSKVMKQQGPYLWVPQDGFLDTVHASMQPSIRFKREDCIDLPPTMYSMYQVEMTNEQKKLYKQMVDSMVAQAKTGTIQAVNAGVQLSKLVQIACGVAYSKASGVVYEPATKRVETARQIIEGAGAQVIMYVPYTAMLEQLYLEFYKDFRTAVVHGSTPKAKRDEIFSLFQAGAIDLLIANPGAMSHGLTLTAANTIIWYAPIMSYEIFDQANHRIIRPGQKSSTLIAMLNGSRVERRIYDKLRKKHKVQSSFLELITA